MAGGYLDDRFVQGKLCTDDKWYYLVHWDVIDIFVYFSHHFVTIPPVGWINCAHRNGVAVLGTFIAEGEGGFKRCDAIFSNKNVSKAVADQLVHIATHYRFEGWLINIETNIRKKNLKSLLDFVRYLTNRMHDAIEGSQVIWYDSVTDEGNLSWQNQLNSRNKVYFDGCDGIFLNYGWGKADLENSVEVAKSSSRVQDVYVGVDVFGRGCYGGGGMNSHVAVELIRKLSLSAAIFAPGWVKEHLGGDQFEANEAQFWFKLAPYCRRHAIILPQHFLHTKFHPGIEFEGAHRYLHLSRQSLFPRMSSAAFLPVPVSQHPHEVAISRCWHEVLFATVFPGMRCDFVDFVVGVKIKDPASTSLNLAVRCGNDLITKSSGQWDADLKTFACVNTDSVNKILCSISDIKADLQEVSVVAFNPLQPGAFGSNWMVASYADGSECIDLSLDDISWKKLDTDVLLSCTLMMKKIHETSPITVFYTSSQTQRVKLGVAYCDRFRIMDLRVPSPVHHGPICKIALEVEQKNPIPSHMCQKLGLVEDNYGELNITYSDKASRPPNPMIES